MQIARGKNDPKPESIEADVEDEGEAIPVVDETDAFAVLDDEDDANPGDRRRDPLRRP